MTDRHAAAASILSAVVVVVVVAASGGAAGPVLLAVVGGLVLGLAMLIGTPAVVVAGVGAQVGAVAWLVGGRGEWPAVAIAAPAVWLAAECAWRWFDLRPGVRAQSSATATWVGASGAIALGSAAFAVVVLGLSRTATTGGLTFRVLGLLAVVGAAGALVVLAARRSPSR